MCAYPKLNGVHCSDNRWLLTEVLRDQWGFDGAVVTDWGAMNDRIAAFQAGCDLNMPGGSGYMEKAAVQAVREGTLPESAVNANARRILKLAFQLAEAEAAPAPCSYGEHHDLAHRAAAEGAVLLKNEGGLLPLEGGSKVAILGAMAKDMRYQGSGSSHIQPTRLSQPLDFLPDGEYAPGYDERGNTTEELLAQAVALARSAQVAVVFIGLSSREES